ncbi:hypothetical protein [Streptomyces sp. NPDC018947]|uniref:hypothetical protein n=1 Tax=Streptomyces sp. NPDC018947 TaxID=3365054 RepID=UPI003791CF1A
MLEQLIDDNDELWRAVERIGRHRLPSLAHIDPYGDTTLSGDAIDRMVRELESADLARLRDGELEVVATLLAWGRRCRADRNLRVTFSGD